MWSYDQYSMYNSKELRLRQGATACPFTCFTKILKEIVHPNNVDFSELPEHGHLFNSSLFELSSFVFVNTC